MYAGLTATPYIATVTVKDAGKPVYQKSEQRVNLSGPCLVTGKTCSVRVSREAFDRWNRGELIQNAMPELSADEREFLISGYSPEGWRQAFGDEE